MDPAPRGSPSYRWLTVVVVVAAGVYAWYAFSQYDRLNQLNHRQLSNAGSELTLAINQALVTVEGFNAKWRSASAAARPRVCSFVNGQPYLELDGCDAGSSPERVEWDLFTSVRADAGTTLGISVTGQTAERRFSYRTDKVLQELAFSDSFSLIFVANDKGVVVAQDTPARRQWLRHLRWGEQAFRDSHLDRPPALQIHNIEQLVGGAEAWQQLRSVTSRTTVSLGGVAHELYLQPLVLDDSGAAELIIGGAVPRVDIVRDALALGTSMVGVMSVVVLFGVLGFPFVKLAVLDRHERFRRRDIVLLYASSGALLVLFTCASLALDGYVRWHVEADRGLETFARQLEGRFVEEVTAIRDQMAEYDEHVSGWPQRDCTRWPVRANWYAQEAEAAEGLAWPPGVHLRTVAWIEPGGWQLWKSTADPVPGRTFVGQRLYFRAVRDDNLFRLDLDGRPIFLGPDRSIADGKFYTFISMRSAADLRALCGGKTSGPLILAVTAQLLSLDRQPLPAGYGFALINRAGTALYHSDGRLSLRENLLDELGDRAHARAMMYAGGAGGFDTRYRARPHRFHFEPVDLFRSRSRDSGSENRAGLLPAALSTGAPADDPAGFYLAVFRDTSVEQALIGHVFVVGLVGPMVLLVGLSMITVVILVYAARREGHSAFVWLWPHRGLDHVYQAQCAAFLALLLIGGGIYARTGNVTPFLLTPILAVALGIAVYRIGCVHQGPRRRLANPVWQRSAVLLFLVCVIMVPSATLFTVALGRQFAKLIVTEQHWIAEQQEDLDRALQVEARAAGYAEQRLLGLREARLRYVACVPRPFDASATEDAPFVPRAAVALVAATSGNPAPAAGRAGSLAGCAPEGNATGGNRLEPVPTRPIVVAALQTLDNLLPADNDIMVRQHFQPGRHAYSPAGTIVPSFRASEIALAGFALTLAGLLWWIGWNTNRLFLGDLDDGDSAPAGAFERIWERCSEDEKMVLLQIAMERIANPYQRPMVEALVKKGLLRLNPDVQPFSDEFAEFLRAKEGTNHVTLERWERVAALHSWRYGRLILAASVGGIGVFLLATQPGLQSSVIGIATGIAGVLTAGFKVRDAIGAWFERKNEA